MNLKKYNIGIIGLGVGEQHLIGFLKNKKCNVKTICDFDKKCPVGTSGLGKQSILTLYFFK